MSRYLVIRISEDDQDNECMYDELDCAGIEFGQLNESPCDDFESKVVW
jgi:hypothetical protein